MPSLVWQAAEQTPKVCYRVVETSHPINNEDFMGKTVRMPKASRMILRFDPLSHLETGDFLSISVGNFDANGKLKDKHSKKVLWKAGRHDVARSGWPGIDAPGIVVEGECFQVSLERLMSLRYGDETVYGYRIIAEAELPPDAVPNMQKQLAGRAGTAGSSASSASAESSASTFVCASILSEAQH